MKRYIEEPDSADVRRLMSECLVATSRLSEIEVASALERRCREGSFPPAERDRAVAALRRDLAAFLVVELTADVVSASLGLLARHPLRAGDAVQLASCLELRRRLGLPVGFAAFDQRLIEAARRESSRRSWDEDSGPMPEWLEPS